MRTALFALNAVLFPGGVLPLRVFEPRYMDMVRGCMKSGDPFGVVLIAKGKEVASPTELELEGTFARITSWDMPQLGLLHIRAIGDQRFRIVGTETQADGLNVAEVEPLPPDADAAIAARHQPCVRLLERIVNDLESNRTSTGDQTMAAVGAQSHAGHPGSAAAELPIEPPYRFDSSVWVGNRLAELLPTNLRAKQKLMALPDAMARLDVVLEYLQQHGVIK